MVDAKRLPAQVERILAKRAGLIREKFAHLDTHHEQPPPPDLLLHGILQDFDEATMSASFVISTEDMDRSGEVVDTAGIRTESHRLNPVALWDHGRGPIGRLPIGKCEDPAGQYMVAIRPHEGISLCRIFFSRTLAFAKDVFQLIGEGIIRGVSIGFRTIDAHPMPGYEHASEDDDPPLHYREIELCEISPTAVPDNARALAIKVNKAFQGRKPSKEMETVVKAWETEKAADASGHEHGSDGKFASSSATAASKKAADSTKGPVSHLANLAHGLARQAEGAKDASARHAFHTSAAYAHGHAATMAVGNKEVGEVHRAAAAAHETAAKIHAKSGEKSMTQTATNKKPKVLGKSFTAELKALSESGVDVLSKALAQITGKSADEYLTMDDDGKLNDETVADTKKDGMNTTSLADGAAMTDGPVDTVKDATADVPAFKQPLEGPPGQAAATDLHTQLGGIAETIEGWAARQDNDRIKEMLTQLAQTIDSAMADIEGFHDSEYDEHDPLGQSGEEKKAAETEQDEATEGGEKPEPKEDDEDDTEKKSVRRLSVKAPARQRHEKRLAALRAKTAKAKGPGKVPASIGGIITKTAGFLEAIEKHTGDWSDVQKAASGYHRNLLSGLAKAGTQDDAETLEAKTWRERAEKATVELQRAVETAEKAVAEAKEERSQKKKLLKGWNEFKRTHGIN